MPSGEKTKYTAQQKRKAGHIEDSYIERGVKRAEAESRAWATLNKQDGGGKKGGSGTKTTTTTTKISKSITSGKAE